MTQKPIMFPCEDTIYHFNQIKYSFSRLSLKVVLRPTIFLHCDPCSLISIQIVSKRLLKYPIKPRYELNIRNPQP